jgi:hypothetical protein
MGADRLLSPSSSGLAGYVCNYYDKMKINKSNDYLFVVGVVVASSTNK